MLAGPAKTSQSVRLRGAPSGKSRCGRLSGAVPSRARSTIGAAKQRREREVETILSWIGQRDFHSHTSVLCLDEVSRNKTSSANFPNPVTDKLPSRLLRHISAYSNPWAEN